METQNMLASAMEKDPVCGMTLETNGSNQMSDYEGKTFYFCCAGCKQAFDKEPGKYV